MPESSKRARRPWTPRELQAYLIQLESFLLYNTKFFFATDLQTNSFLSQRMSIPPFDHGPHSEKHLGYYIKWPSWLSAGARTIY